MNDEPLTDEERAALIRAFRVYDMELEKLGYMMADAVQRDWSNGQRLALRRATAKLGQKLHSWAHREPRG